MKIRCGANTGIDLDQVVAWSQISYQGEEILLLYFAGASNSFDVSAKTVGSQQAFAYLCKLVIDRFAIDLAGDNDLFSPEHDDSSVDEPLELSF